MKNLTEHINKIIPPGQNMRPPLNGHGANYKSARRKEPSELDEINVERLFGLFLDTWDEHWARKGGATPGKIKQWAEVLAGKTFEELQQAHQKARITYDYPPTIKQFTDLCDKSPAALEGFNHAKSIDMTYKKLERIVTTNHHVFTMVSMIFRDLEKVIYETRSEHCDFATCAASGCYNYEVFEKPYLGAWLCVQHDKGK